MNILHMKYAVEVAKCGSVNKASESLSMDQSNLSRAIKDLESSIGVDIFIRSPKGMVTTSDGETFLKYASRILNQVEELEQMFNKNVLQKKKFSISVPRATYISDAFSNFSLYLNTENNIEIFYKETNSQRTIKNILDSNYNLGIIRYADHFSKFFQELLNEKELSYELITTFQYVIIVNKNNPLAKQTNIKYRDLKNYIEIAHSDPFVPYLSLSEVKKKELPDNINRRIFVFERASQFDILSRNNDTFMWVSSIPQTLLDRYNLVQKKCNENLKYYKDVMIYKNDYKLSHLDRQFINELNKSKQKLFYKEQKI